MDPTLIYISIVGFVVVICVGALIFGKEPTRTCPQCGGQVSIMARTCRACRYRFSV